MKRCYTYPVRILRLKSNLTIKIVLITSVLFCFLFIWSQKVSQSADINDNLYYEDIKVLSEDILQNVHHVFNYAAVYRKKDQLLKDVKFILLWSYSEFAPLNILDHGQKAFIENNCSSINCYTTNNKNFFGGDLTRFNAIAFNGRDGQLNYPFPQYYLPYERSPHQKYIYCNSESAPNNPVINEFYNGYFNLTATYRLDSEIVFKYISILNLNGDVVGPKVNMKWLNEMADLRPDETFKISAKSKKYAAAWFVSNCKSLSLREELVPKLQKELHNYKLDIHIYGDCGNYTCPQSEKAKCNAMLERDYYFYLSFENSFDKDYVTEKVLTALNHNVVPIVYGGANYSRFLPPGSYINAREMTVRELASLMYQLIKKPKLYFKYFRWKRYYRFASGMNEYVCAFCSTLNGKSFEEYSSYDNFLNWWNTNYSTGP